LLCRWKDAKQGTEGLVGESNAETPRTNEGKIPDTKKPGFTLAFLSIALVI